MGALFNPPDPPSGPQEPKDFSVDSDGDSPPEPLPTQATSSPEPPERRRKLRRHFAVFLFVLVCCLVGAHYGRKYLPLFWNDIHIVNFCVNIAPTIFSIVFAFVVDKDLADRVKWRWLFRILVPGLGLGLSCLLWHQQILADKQSVDQINTAVTKAVTDSNRHADEKFGDVKTDVKGVQDQVTGLGQSLDRTTKALSDEVDKTSAALTSSIGKVGKPEPPERPKLRFSLWREDLPENEFPLESMTVQPDKDGTLHIPFFVKNDSGVQAEGVEIWVYICDICSFAKEPTGFDKPEGLTDHARHKSIPAMNPGVGIRENNLIDIKVNQEGPALTQIMFKSTCKTCGVPETSKRFLINIGPSLTQQ